MRALTREQNRRRGELIDKKYRDSDGLTATEEVELKGLQERSIAYMQAKYPPLFNTEELERLRQRLESGETE